MRVFTGIKSLEINLAGQPTSERHRTPILHRFPVLNTVCDLFRKRLLATSQLPIVGIGYQSVVLYVSIFRTSKFHRVCSNKFERS